MVRLGNKNWDSVKDRFRVRVRVGQGKGRVGIGKQE